MKSPLAMLFGILCGLLAMLSAAPARAQAPHSLGGLTLGENISTHRHLLVKESDLMLRSAPYLREIRLKPGSIEGFGEGSVYYSNCDKPGRIVRIKLEYADPSQDGFDRLLAEYKARFGDPDEWRGDAFHNIIAWKWGLKDKDGRRVTIVLSHSNLEEDKPGNWVKLTLRSLWNAEEQCWREKHPGGDDGPAEGASIKRMSREDFLKLIPE